MIKEPSLRSRQSEDEHASHTATVTPLRPQAGDELQAFAILDALPATIAVLDANGRIIAINERWQRAVDANAYTTPAAALHLNYLAICERAAGDAATSGPQAAAGIRAVLAGDEAMFTLEYSAATADTQRWFQMIVTPLTTGRARGAVVLHTDISERKCVEADLATAHRHLVNSSRRAGMAEVASSVLHNVGNVLNSVNVAANVAIENVKNSKAPSLARVVTLLREHDADPGAFLAHDPQGRQVPGFLAQLAERLQDEQAAMLKELELLRQHVDHIKQIVATQQTHAKVSGLSELLSVEELVEDSLRFVADALHLNGVAVRREFVQVPTIEVDKHKAVQILVNLIRNAKFACIESMRPDKRLTLRIDVLGSVVQIAVGDNGVGIAQDHLTRIFSHGFTTRKDGHGFGLHSGALAARELGGSLHAHSDGPGRGATFTLSLPLQRPGPRP